MRVTNPVLIGILAVAVIACSATRPPLPPTLSIQLPSNEWGDFTLDVYDESGLVTGGRSGEQSLGGVTPTKATVSPDGMELAVDWTGGACSHRPLLFVRGDAEKLDLVIVPSPVELSLAPPEGCPAIGILSSAAVTLSQPVPQENVAIETQQ